MKKFFTFSLLAGLTAASAIAAPAAKKSQAKAPAAASTVISAPQIVATGGIAPELPGAVWVSGKPVKLADFKGKQHVVLFFWTFQQSSFDAIPKINAMAKEYQGRGIAFIGIGCNEPKQLKGFLKMRSFDFPVMADDRLLALNRFLRLEDRVPVAVVVDKSGRLVWRGRCENLPRVLNELISGKFDLADEIRREKFSKELSSAMRKKDYDSVLRLSEAELKRHPGNVELLSLRAGVFTQIQKKPEKALQELDAAIAGNLRNLPLYELKLKVLRISKKDNDLSGFYRQIIANFGDMPLVLLKFADGELSRPISENRPEHFCNLVRAAYRSTGCKTEKERGIVAIAYARMCHLAGRPDLALAAAKKSASMLKNEKELYQETLAYIRYYKTLMDIAKQL